MDHIEESPMAHHKSHVCEWKEAKNLFGIILLKLTFSISF